MKVSKQESCPSNSVLKIIVPADVVTGHERRPRSTSTKRRGTKTSNNKKRKRNAASTAADDTSGPEGNAMSVPMEPEVKEETKLKKSKLSESLKDEKFVQIVGIDLGMSGSG